MDQLRRLQRASYARLGITPPDLTAKAEQTRYAASVKAAERGGSVEQEMRKSLAANGLDPDMAEQTVTDIRDAIQQQRDAHRFLPSSNSDEKPLSNPHHCNILNLQRRRIEQTIPYLTPAVAQTIQPLVDHVLIDELPTGELNARTFLVPQTPAAQPSYWILFDPIFFDFFYSLSNIVASIIDTDNLMNLAARYASHGADSLITDAIRTDVARHFASLFDTLFGFVVYGAPPALLQPYDERGFGFAEALRDRAALFVVAHEYGHIMQGDLQPASNATLPWVKEVRADQIGWQLTATALGLENVAPAWRIMGANFLFIGFIIVELTRNALRQGHPQTLAGFMPGTADPTASHPRPTARLGLILQEFRRHYGPQQAGMTDFFAALLFELVQRFWTDLEPAFLKMHTDGVRPRPLWKGMYALEQGL